MSIDTRLTTIERSLLEWIRPSTVGRDIPCNTRELDVENVQFIVTSMFNSCFLVLYTIAQLSYILFSGRILYNATGMHL